MLPIEPLNHHIQRRYNNLPQAHKLGIGNIKFEGDYLLIHAWKSGYVELTLSQADILKKAMCGAEVEGSMLSELPQEWLEDADSEPNLDGILSKVIAPGFFELLSIKNLDKNITHHQALRLRKVLEGIANNLQFFLAIQNEYELRSFMDTVKLQQPKTVVEIGTAGGGVFYCLSQLAHPEALLVSIDYDNGPYGGGQDSSEVELYSSFCGPKQRTAFIRDRSFHYSTKLDLKNILDGKKIELLFIDGDHSYGGVYSDFNMYKDLMAPGGVIAFHDINLRPENWGRGCDVGIFWDEMKQLYLNHREIIDPKGCTSPLGLLQKNAVFAYGIGILTDL